MVVCEHCGSRFSPLQAAVLRHCPECEAREGVSVPLISSLFKVPRPIRKMTGDGSESR
jgi:hypothetical protein